MATTALRASRRIPLLERRSFLATTTTTIRPRAGASAIRTMASLSTFVLLDHHPFQKKWAIVVDPTNTNHPNAGLRVLLRRNLGMVTQQKAEETLSPPPPVVIVTSSTNNDASSSAPNVAPAQSNHHKNDADAAKALTITDSCWQRIRKLAANKHDESLFLRVFVDAGGCSGFQYQFELDSGAVVQDDDVVFYNEDKDHNNDHNKTATPRVVVDQQSLNYMRGATIDYVQEMIKSSFEVRNNPQSESACGCGSSFAVKNFSSNPALD